MKDLNVITSDPNVKTLFDPVTAAEMLRIDPEETVLAPPVILSINDNSGISIPSFTSGNFSLIIGKAKSKKTFLITLFIASFLGYKNQKIIGNSSANNSVVWFDTEQSPYHLLSMVKRVCSLINKQNPENLYVYQLRTLNPEERIQLIEHIIHTIPANLIIIDGIRDLVADINSPDQATRTATMLMKWSAENNTHLINVLHQNKGDSNARGHLGTELTNKAETVISVEASEESCISVVRPEYCRDVEFTPFSFKINEASLPELCQIPEKVSDKKNMVNPCFITNDRHIEVLNNIYRKFNGESPSYHELMDSIINGFNGSFGDTKCRKFISHYLTNKWISKSKEGHKVFYKYERAIF